MKHKDLPAKPVWFIVNMCSRWKKDQIDRHRKPTRVHHSLASAYEEATRLAELHTQGDYAIFECIGRVASAPEKLPADSEQVIASAHSSLPESEQPTASLAAR